jgi:uncharacterized protein (TIGR03435 family)
MRSIVGVAMALFCANSHAQTAPATAHFEVASVRPAANHGPGGSLPPVMREIMRNNRQPGAIPLEDPGRIRLDNWALLDLIAAAYRVRANQVSGPSWLADQDFDLEAKLPGGTQQDQLNGMLQSLLEDRFGLRVHREEKTRQGFALVIGRDGPKLKAAEAALLPEERQERSAALAKRLQENRENGAPLEGFRRGRWPSVTTAEFATILIQFTEAPVVDETGLTGKYSIAIETWKNPDVPGGTVFDAVKNLGLKLEPRKITVETVVVDQVSRMPTAN